MKKLRKLKLNDFQEMSDSEIKNAIGGYGSSGSSNKCSNDGCSGNCTTTIQEVSVGGKCLMEGGSILYPSEKNMQVFS